MLKQLPTLSRGGLALILVLVCLGSATSSFGAGAGLVKVFADWFRPSSVSSTIPKKSMPTRFDDLESVSRQLMKDYERANLFLPPFMLEQKQRELEESLWVFVGKKRLSGGASSASVAWLSQRFSHSDSIADFSRRAFGRERVDEYIQRLRVSSDNMMVFHGIDISTFQVDSTALKRFVGEWGKSAEQLVPLCEKAQFRQQLKQDIDRTFSRIRRQSSSGYMAAVGPMLEREINAQLKWLGDQWIRQLPASLSKKVVQLQRFSVKDGKVTAELVSVCGLTAEAQFHTWGQPVKLAAGFDGTYAVTPRLNKALLK